MKRSSSSSKFFFSSVSFNRFRLLLLLLNQLCCVTMLPSRIYPHNADEILMIQSLEYTKVKKDGFYDDDDVDDIYIKR